MNNFDYARANDVADAVRQIAADPAAKFIAGGTNLIDLMKENVARPSRLIDITRLPLDKIEQTKDGGLRIGDPGEFLHDEIVLLLAFEACRFELAENFLLLFDRQLFEQDVKPVACLALLAVDHRIGEILDMP